MFVTGCNANVDENNESALVTESTSEQNGTAEAVVLDNGKILNVGGFDTEKGEKAETFPRKRFGDTGLYLVGKNSQKHLEGFLWEAESGKDVSDGWGSYRICILNEEDMVYGETFCSNGWNYENHTVLGTDKKNFAFTGYDN